MSAAWFGSAVFHVEGTPRRGWRRILRLTYHHGPITATMAETISTLSLVTLLDLVRWTPCLYRGIRRRTLLPAGVKGGYSYYKLKRQWGLATTVTVSNPGPRGIVIGLKGGTLTGCLRLKEMALRAFKQPAARLTGTLALFRNCCRNVPTGAQCHGAI